MLVISLITTNIPFNDLLQSYLLFARDDKKILKKQFMRAEGHGRLEEQNGSEFRWWSSRVPLTVTNWRNILFSVTFLTLGRANMIFLNIYLKEVKMVRYDSRQTRRRALLSSYRFCHLCKLVTLTLFIIFYFRVGMTIEQTSIQSKIVSYYHLLSISIF